MQDWTNYPVLQIFKESHNPTQVAKHLNMPANALHYRVKKLAQVGLLKQVSQQGRKRNYQSVSQSFKVHRDLVESMQETLGFTKDLFNKVAHGFELAEQEYVEKGFQNKAKDYIEFGLNEKPPLMKDYEPCLSVYEIPLTKEQYQRLTQKLLEVAREIKDEGIKKQSKPCTVTIMAFAKGSTFPAL